MILLAECSNGDAQDGIRDRNGRLKEPVADYVTQIPKQHVSVTTILEPGVGGCLVCN